MDLIKEQPGTTIVLVRKNPYDTERRWTFYHLFPVIVTQDEWPEGMWELTSPRGAKKDGPVVEAQECFEALLAAGYKVETQEVDPDIDEEY